MVSVMSFLSDFCRSRDLSMVFPGFGHAGEE